MLVSAVARLAHGQDSQFTFDFNGNLASQATATFAPPQILAHPRTQVVRPGELGSFFVVASDTRDLAYQWRFNGTNIANATNDTFLLTNVGATNEGLYSVVLTNSSGSVTSVPAALMLDSRGCGMPDSWQLTYFGNLTNTATGDYDYDGVSNLQEFLDGTNPTNSASARFRLTVLWNDGTVQVVPLQASYTNGQLVTLTATAFAPDIFRGWAGAINTTNNPATLTITNNATVFAYLGPSYIVWTSPASGDWNVATNWSPNIVPGFDDTVVIDGNLTVTVNSNAECGNLTLGSSGNSPTLSGSGTLTIHGISTWISGTMNGGGQTVIMPGASLILANPSTLSLNNRVFENGGTISWAGADNLGSISLINAVITNRAGAFFQARTSSSILNQGGTARFDNAGTFSKSASTGTPTLGCTFNNSGTLDLQTGSLALQGGGTNSGTITVPAGTALNLSGTFLSDSASSIASAGNFTVSGGTATVAGLINLSGTLTVSGGTANLDGTGTVSPAVVDLSGGTLGGADLVTVGSLMNWTGGAVMSGSGRTVIAPGATLNAASALTLSLTSRTLENGGTVLWTGAGLYLTGAVITNRAGALFHAQSDTSFLNQGGAARFDNAGIFRKSASSGTTTLSSGVTFNSSGTVDLQSGTLALLGGGTNGGTITVPAGTTLNLSGTFMSDGASSIAGAGNFTVSGGTATLAGLVNLNGTNLFSSGTANLTGNYICTNNTLAISGGTANLDGTGTVSPAVVNLNGGTLGGAGLVTVGNLMNWTGGTMSGSGRTVIATGATLNLAGAFTLSLTGRTLENGGTVLWTGAGMYLTGGVITNRAGALFEAQNAASLSYQGGTCRFDNAGTFRKSSSAGTTTFDNGVAFNNYGTVDLRSRILAANGGYTSTANAVLNCALGGAAAGTGYAQLQVAGTVALNGSLTVGFTNAYLPALNDSFTVVAAGTRNGTFANFYYPSNAVTMQLSNTTSSVVVRVTGVAPPRPVLLSPTLSGTNALLTWTAVSNTSYRLEFNPDLTPSNWNALPGDVLATSNTASKQDTATPTNRFYRVRALP